jgi:hypothetical protein
MKRVNLNTLDVSRNTVLIRLYCSNNQLIALDVSRNTDAISESIYRVRRFEQIVEDNMAEISEPVKQNDAVATSRFMRKVLFG